MKRGLIGVVCVASLVVAGCGGSSDRASTGPATTREAACAKLVPAKKRYVAETEKMGLRFFDKFYELPARSAAEAFLSRAREVRKFTAGADRRVLDKLATALDFQVKTFRAFEVHKEGEAKKYGDKINAPLTASLGKLHTVCPGA
jgi:hypothetical protein